MCGDAEFDPGAELPTSLLDVNVEQEACPLNLAPTSSTTVMLALGDALAMVLLEARGFQERGFREVSSRREWSGAACSCASTKSCGRAKRSRSFGRMRTSAPCSKAMTAVRAGAAVVADEDESSARDFHPRRFRPAFPNRPARSASGWWRI